jgi:hypothetical protein
LIHSSNSSGWISCMMKVRLHWRLWIRMRMIGGYAKFMKRGAGQFVAFDYTVQFWSICQPQVTGGTWCAKIWVLSWVMKGSDKRSEIVTHITGNSGINWGIVTVGSAHGLKLGPSLASSVFQCNKMCLFQIHLIAQIMSSTHWQKLQAWDSTVGWRWNCVVVICGK